MLAKPAPNLPEAAFVYGSGTFAAKLIRILRSLDITVLGVLDHVNEGCIIEGQSVQGISGLNLQGSEVFLGIHNFRADIFQINTALVSAGASRILTPPMFGSMFASLGIPFDNYWLANDFDLDSKFHEFEWVRSKLADDHSKELLLAIAKYRREGRVEDCPQPEDLSLQYFPPGLDFLGPQDQSIGIHYLDVGAFDGDTLRNFSAKNVVAAKYYAIEPEPSNFAKLVQTAQRRDFETVCLPFAASNRNEIVFFDASSDGSSESDSGSLPIQSVRLDDVLNNVRVSHIKFDIEGAEYSAIQGLQGILLDQRPKLAISVYHKPDDLWVLLGQVDSLGLYSRYYLRNYGHQTFDTILYCLP